jgi:hypothetical protein
MHMKLGIGLLALLVGCTIYINDGDDDGHHPPPTTHGSGGGSGTEPDAGTDWYDDGGAGSGGWLPDGGTGSGGWLPDAGVDPSFDGGCAGSGSAP